MLSETACKANAFGMTYLGEKALLNGGWEGVVACSNDKILNWANETMSRTDFRDSVNCESGSSRPAEVHDGYQG